ncbi:hypothetical protein [Lysobacter sp. F6437]|uniref:hypothetical protein n=1 Tax=Lysobacter sp. F6437 TaxID=3459296 RepID=UPI00403D85CC
MDAAWWHTYIGEVRAQFRGERVTSSSQCGRHGVAQLRGPEGAFDPFGNSGAGAVALARLAGASRVLLLGYDCQHSDTGKRHWHGDHPAGTAGNAAPKTVAKWPAQFQKLARYISGTEVINCSRTTALTVFPRATLEEALT